MIIRLLYLEDPLEVLRTHKYWVNPEFPEKVETLKNKFGLKNLLRPCQEVSKVNESVIRMEYDTKH